MRINRTHYRNDTTKTGHKQTNTKFQKVNHAGLSIVFIPGSKRKMRGMIAPCLYILHCQVRSKSIKKGTPRIEVSLSAENTDIKTKIFGTSANLIEIPVPGKSFVPFRFVHGKEQEYLARYREDEGSPI